MLKQNMAIGWQPTEKAAGPGLLERACQAMLLISFVAVIGRQALAAPLRAYGAELWYVPDGIMFAALPLLVISLLSQGRLRVVSVVLGLMLWSVLSLIVLHPLSVLFGMRFVLAFIAALATGMLCRRLDGLLRLALIGLCGLTIAGAIFESLFDLPWSGLRFDGAFGTKEVSRQWWLEDETRRIAGLGISSTDTALFISCAMLMISTGNRRSSRVLGLLLIGPALYALWLTQQRAAMAWFGILWSVSFLYLLVLGHTGAPAATRALKLAGCAATFGCVVAPFALYDVDVGGIFGFSASSLLDRTKVVWPWAIERALSIPQLLFGSGLGSVGEAAAYTDVNMSLPPDNMFLFLLTLCGLGAFGMVWLVIRGILAITETGEGRIPALAVLVLLLLNGVTANIVGGLVGISFLGLSLGTIFRSEAE
ncbi:MAG: hypothetical protein JWM36_871 [Hyphomicrobiales bacterium]|nr:hypothetical protein [Hyphomicrobiales bacterium]